MPLQLQARCGVSEQPPVIYEPDIEMPDVYVAPDSWSLVMLGRPQRALPAREVRHVCR